MPDVVPPPVGMDPCHGEVLGGCSRVHGQGLATCCGVGACSGPLEGPSRGGGSNSVYDGPIGWKRCARPWGTTLVNTFSTSEMSNLTFLEETWFFGGVVA